MRAVVTGGSGFIGRALLAVLGDRGWDLTVLDRRHPLDTGALDDAHGVRVVVGDIRDPASVAEAVGAGTDVVFHLAAVTSVLVSKEDPVETFETNVAATQTLLERARHTGTPRFVMASTNAVTGVVVDRDIDERTPLAPLTPYGATKAASEMLMSAYSASYGVRCAAVRLTNVFGPGMGDKDSFVPRLMRAALDGTAVAIYGDGEQRRDLVFVRDAVAGIVLAADREVSGPIIIGSGRSVSVLELHREVCVASGVEIPLRHEDAKAGEMPVVSVDIGRARSYGYEPSVGLREGLIETWNDFRRGAGEEDHPAA